MEDSKRRYTETHTKRDLEFCNGGPVVAKALACSLEFFLKLCILFGWGKNCTGKTKGLALQSLNRLINDFSIRLSF